MWGFCLQFPLFQYYGMGHTYLQNLKMLTNCKNIEIPQRQKNIIERLKILFFGVKWDEIEIFFFENTQLLRSIINNSKNIKNDSLKNEKDKIVVILIESNHIKKEEEFNLIKSILNAKFLTAYFFIKNKKQIHLVANLIDTLGLGNFELYGIDPDYFFSLVPIRGNNHKTIESYVLKLKTDLSKKGKLKNIIKELLVSLGLSKIIYEGFVIEVTGLRKARLENTNTY